MNTLHAASIEDVNEIARRLGFDLFIHGIRGEPGDWPPGVLDGFLLAQSRPTPDGLPTATCATAS